MSFESFYGGRIGASFVIVEHFDGIKRPTTSSSEEAEKYRYSGKYLALTNDKAYVIYNNNSFIERNGENYHKYNWRYYKYNGATVQTKTNVEGTGNSSSQTLPIILAQYMVECFEQGGSSTNQVNYGEYVIIDTPDKQNPDNGKVFRRGMNYSNDPNGLGGAEYIGQIVGPKGESPELSVNHYDTIKNNAIADGTPYAELIYNEASADLVPGSTKNSSGARSYEDNIKWIYTTIRDEIGNITGCAIGFKIPTLVMDFVANSITPYDNTYRRGTGTSADPYRYEGLIYEDPAQYVSNKWIHPFYQKWQIKIPQGVHGIDSTNIELVHTKTMPAGYKKNFAGTPLYTNVACTTPYISGGSAVVLTSSIDILKEDFEYVYNNPRSLIYDASDSVISCKVEYNGQTLYVKKSDCYMDILRYRETDYSDTAAGKVIYHKLGDYNTIQRVTLSDRGILTVYYSAINTPQVLEETLRWINANGVTLDDHGTLTVYYNTFDGSGNRENSQFYQKIRWIDKIKGITMDDHGTVDVYYNTLDGSGNNDKEHFYQKIKWIDKTKGITLDDNGTIRMYYNTLDGSGNNEYEQFTQVLKWIDNVHANGIQLDNDGTVTIWYNTLDGSGNHEKQVYSNILDWITSVTLDQQGNFDILYNNTTIQDGHYHQDLKWIDYVSILDDGTVNFYWNSDTSHSIPAFSFSKIIKYIDDLKIQTKAPGNIYEGSGDQKIHVTYNTTDSSGNKITETIGNPINYIIEAVVTDPKVCETSYPSTKPYHLLVYYADPLFRLGKSDTWVTYPSTKVIDGYTPTGDPIYHAWTEWVDLGNIKGHPGGVHNLTKVLTINDLKDPITGLDIPPEQLKDSLGNIINPNAYGWSVMVGDPTATPLVYEVMFFDYDTDEWYSVGDIDYSAINPELFIVQSIPVSPFTPDPSDVSSLKEGGFWFSVEESLYAF